MAAGLNLQKLLHKPEGLAGFMEGAGAVLRYPFAVGSDLQKFFFALGICFLFCHLSCQHGISLCIVNGCLAADDHCL